MLVNWHGVREREQTTLPDRLWLGSDFIVA